MTREQAVAQVEKAKKFLNKKYPVKENEELTIFYTFRKIGEVLCTGEGPDENCIVFWHLKARGKIRTESLSKIIKYFEQHEN